MSQTVFKAVVTGIGDCVNEMISEGMLILFDEQVKDTVPELSDYCLLLDISYREGQISTGDILKIVDNEFEIKSVGDVVNTNIKNLGHCVLVFNGNKIAELPGNIHLPDVKIPEISVNSTIEILKM